MRIVHGDQVEEKIRIHQHRQGMFRHRTVAAGEPGTPGNFILELVRTTDDFFSPRHKHNFDQFRYQLEGEFDFDRNGKMTPGTIGYFPEGTPYGPQSSSVSSLTLVLQFGGASGNGYMTQEHFDWVPVAGAPGACEKLMGVFTERGCEARFLRLAPAARIAAPGRKLYFVLTGDGRLDGEAYRRTTTLSCERGEQATFEAETPTEILVLGLPKLDVPAHYAI